MRHSRSVLAAVAALALLPVAALALPGTSAAHETPGPGVHPARINLPDGWQPEGITTDQEHLYVGSLATGAIWKADPRTGNGMTLWPGDDGSTAVGVDYDRIRNLIWVAGGQTGEVRAHDAETGDLRATYLFEDAELVNDLTVTRRGVYATDSRRPVLLVVPLKAPPEPLPEPGVEVQILLTGDYEHVPDEFNLNGIVTAAGRSVLAVQSVNGNLYSIKRRTGASTLVAVENADLTSGDGLERRGERLYVVRNFLNKIVALEQTGEAQDGTPTEYTHVSTITSDSFRVPTTVAAARGFLYAVNARFNVERARAGHEVLDHPGARRPLSLLVAGLPRRPGSGRAQSPHTAQPPSGGFRGTTGGGCVKPVPVAVSALSVRCRRSGVGSLPTWASAVR